MPGNQLRSSSFRASCPICGAAVSTTVGAVMDGRIVHCVQGHEIQLVDRNDGLRRFDRELSKLNRTLGRLSRRR